MSKPKRPNEFVEQVREFQRIFDPKNLSDNPYRLEGLDLRTAEKLLNLRQTLIDEEVLELKEAMFDLLFTIKSARSNHRSLAKHLMVSSSDAVLEWHEAKVDLADALGDILVVTIGTALALGIDIEEVMRRIHKSNMSKLDKDGKPLYRKDGKVMKGENYIPPYLEDLV